MYVYIHLRAPQRSAASTISAISAHPLQYSNVFLDGVSKLPIAKSTLTLILKLLHIFKPKRHTIGTQCIS